MLAKQSSRQVVALILVVFPLVLLSITFVPSLSVFLAPLRAFFCLDAFLTAAWFFVGMYFAAHFLFPVVDLQTRNRAFMCLLSWFMGAHRSSYVVRDGQFEERIKGDNGDGIAGVILVDSSSAAVVETPLGYTRTLLPSAVRSRRASRVLRSSTFFVQRFERIRQAVDLRQQVEQQTVQALTRDGMPVRYQLHVEFQIGRYKPLYHDVPPPFSVEPRDIYRAVYGEGLHLEEQDQEEAEEHKVEPGLTETSAAQPYSWKKAVMTEAANELRNILASYRLDDLYASHDLDRTPHAEIEQRLWEGLQPRLESHGVELLGVNLGVLRPSNEVVAQKIDSWRAFWRQKSDAVLARGEAEKQRKREIARALAQLEMIQGITQALEEVPAHYSEEVASLCLTEALERMIIQASARRAELPADDRAALDSLRRRLELSSTAGTGQQGPIKETEGT